MFPTCAVRFSRKPAGGFTRKTNHTALTFFFLLFFIASPGITALRADEADVKAADLVTDDQPINVHSEKYRQFFKELINTHQFTAQELSSLFSGLTIDRRVLELMDTQWEGKPYYEYYPLFITPSVISEGKQSLERYHELFDHIEGVYAVNREVIVAIWAIESRFGTNQGGFDLFRTLNTLFDAYPRRADFFRKELLNLLILSKKNGLDPLQIKGSYAGAFGQAQFMPSSYITYGVDFDNDGHCDLIHSMPDIFASIANYLKTFGWVFDAPVYAELGGNLLSSKLVATYVRGRQGRIDWRDVKSLQNTSIPRPPGDGELSIIGLEVSPDQGGGMRYIAGYPNFQAITEYNHSHKYAMAVSEMANAFIK